METFIKETILKAGEVILSHFGSAKITHSKKTVTDIVTEADLASEKIIIEAIKSNYPTHGIVSEESEDYQSDADYVWYIDPLDGTKNFQSGVQLFGINMAVTFKGKLKYAAIYMPLLKELCYAEEGRGAFVNDVQVFCSQKQDWSGVYGIGPVKYSEKKVEFEKAIAKISDNTSWINSLGCVVASGILMASGRRDFYLGTSSNSWDYAAPALVSKEAGCIVTNFKGEEWVPGDKGIVIANKHLHPQLIEIVKRTYSQN